MGDFIVPKHRQITFRHVAGQDGLLSGPGVDGRIVFAGGQALKPLTTQVRVHISGTRVYVLNSAPESLNEVMLDMPWKAAMELARTLKKEAIAYMDGFVQIIEGDTLLLEVPVTAAFQLAKAVRRQAAQAEQNEKVLKVIMDQALLIRKGFPIALTKNPEVFKEAGNEAAWDTDLRRFVPGGVPGGVVFGNPGLYDAPGPRKRHSIGAHGVPSAETFGRIGGR